MMQAAVLNKFKEPLEIKQVEIPKPEPDDVLIKIIACGVCHTDLHFIRGGKIKTKKNSIYYKIFSIRLGNISTISSSYSGS
jgi:D-arabinose 1-dehydrogenase-like Zn-dependent alcohol dehydrogenase